MILDDVLQDKLQQARSTQPTTSTESIALCDFVLGLIAKLSINSEASENDCAEECYLKNYLYLITDIEALSQQYNTIVNNPSESDQRLLSLAFHLALSDYEIMTLALLLGVEKNTMIGRCIAYVQSPVGGSRPTLGLLDSIFAQFKSDDRCTAGSLILSGKAMEMGLMKVLNSNAPIPEQSLSLPIPLVIALQGLEAKWPKSRGHITKRLELPSSIIIEAKKQSALLYQKPKQVLIIRAGCRTELENITARITKYRFQRPLFIERDSENLAGLVAYLYLHASTPVFEYDLGPNDNQRIPTIPGYDGPIIVICSKEGVLEYPQGTTITWNIDKPIRRERFELWEKQLPKGTAYQELAE